jgi:uncharacterized membrane protein
MPAPDALKRLQAIYPNSPEIIFGQMVSQAEHRQKLEASVVATKNMLALRGQIIGGVLGGTGLVGALIVVGLGHDTAGAAIAGTCLVSLVSVFLYGHEAQRKNLAAKAEIQSRIGNGEPIERLEANKTPKKPATQTAQKAKSKQK